ncbi:MAG: hypothetical protein R3F34_11885 [Planctomycetota bacterium]
MTSNSAITTPAIPSASHSIGTNPNRRSRTVRADGLRSESLRATHAARYGTSIGRGAVVALAFLGLAACGGRGGRTLPLVDQAVGQVGTGATKPEGTQTAYNGDQYLVDPHDGGTAGTLRLMEMYWGRLVDIYDFDSLTATSNLVYSDFIIGDNIASEVGKWTVQTNAVTGETRVTVQYKNQIGTDLNLDGVVDFRDKDNFDLLVEELAATPTTIEPHDVDETGQFTRIARNGAIGMRFQDLVDESTIILNDTVKVLTGSPPTMPFDARIIADPNFGGVDPVTNTFHSTRIIVDTTVSEFEQITIEDSVSTNTLGLPGSSSVLVSNVAIQIPTTVGGGQFNRLRNLAGKPIGEVGNEPIVSSLPTKDVIRAMRTGTPDEDNNGFLLDNESPTMVASQNVIVPGGTVLNAVAPTDAQFGYEFLIDMSFSIIGCAVDAAPGDVVQFSNTLFGEVVQSTPQSGGTVNALRVRIPREQGSHVPADLGGSAVYLFGWRSTFGSTQAPCFLRFSPSAQSPPVGAVPNDAQVSIRFSEAMDPSSFGAYKSFRITRNQNASTMHQFVIGEIGFAPSLREFRFIPALPFSNQAYTGDTNPLDYFVTLVSDETSGGVRDLAGNFLSTSLPANTAFTVSNSTVISNGGYAFGFEALNLDENGDGTSDTRGQFLQDVATGSIAPRAVSHFSKVIDTTIPIVAAMATPAAVGLQTPLSNLGSRLHKQWRYADMGMNVSRTDGSFYDIDVEFTYLNPVGGQVTAAFYPEFLQALAHSAHNPDEWANDGSGYVVQTNSGFATNTTYDDTYLQVPGANPKIVHAPQLGFEVSSAGIFTAETGLPLLRFPLNNGLAVQDRKLFTWRDTSETKRGALLANGNTKGYGVPLRRELEPVGITECYGSVWGGGNDKGVPTAGLPLLLEYRCYPTETLSLINFGFLISSGTSNQPKHRAFSTGGYNTAGAAVVKNPDLETNPTGGFNGVTGPGLPQLGAPTTGLDNSVYFGQTDFVVRVSRAFTILVDANGNADPNYVRLLQEPSPALQPLGTSISFAFRGHDSNITGASTAMFNAGNIDVYGEQVPTNANGLTQVTSQPGQVPITCGSTGFVPFVFENPTWSSNINSVDLLRFVQYRISFVSNLESELVPRLSSFSVAYQY